MVLIAALSTIGIEINPQKPGPKRPAFWQTTTEIEELILQVRLAANYGPMRIQSELAEVDVYVGKRL